MKIAIITPVRNEEKYIYTTINCMIRQTILPVKWVIVNDGSSDNTEQIIKNFLKTASFIKYLAIADRGFRKPAYGVIEAFYEGFKQLKNVDYDILAKFDADLKFPPETLENILMAFKNNPKLGITGGVRYERRNNKGPYKKVLVPKGFVGGPYKFYRKKCFDDIGGLIRGPGWDGVDIIKANMNGWETGELESLKIFHLKSTGTAKGEGLKKAYEKDGYINYYMGGYLWYFALRIIGRSLITKNPMVGGYMIKGYLRAISNKEPRESKKFRRFLKKTQLKNIANWIKLALKINNRINLVS